MKTLLNCGLLISDHFSNLLTLLWIKVLFYKCAVKLEWSADFIMHSLCWCFSYWWRAGTDPGLGQILLGYRWDFRLAVNHWHFTVWCCLFVSLFCFCLFVCLVLCFLGRGSVFVYFCLCFLWGVFPPICLVLFFLPGCTDRQFRLSQWLPPHHLWNADEHKAIAGGLQVLQRGILPYECLPIKSLMVRPDSVCKGVYIRLYSRVQTAKSTAKLDCISLVCLWPCGTILSALLKHISQLPPPYSPCLVKEEIKFF